MRQVVNCAKGGPLLGHSSCMVVRSDADDCSSEHHQQNELLAEDQDNYDQDDYEYSYDDQDDHDDQHQRHQRNENSPKSKGPRQQIERERRLRREIANSNERRRMQSINQGYMSLKGMLPMGDGGEKLSKAAVLQNAADYMAQILEERKQLLLRNAELTRALSEQRPLEESIKSHKRRKRDMTESSDEGISMSYQPASNEAEVMDELKRKVVELGVQLERESQRRAFLEQSYNVYSLMAAQAAANHPPVMSPNPGTVDLTQLQPAQLCATTAPLSPPQSRHASTDELTNEGAQYNSNSAFSFASSLSSQFLHQQPATPASNAGSASRGEGSGEPQTFGKASSVASQNLSIIVEAINHLEGDKPPLSSNDKEVDSGLSQSESSDDTKSDGSETPQPPPAHQSSHSQLRPVSSSLYSPSGLLQSPYAGPLPIVPSVASSTVSAAPVPLLYRPTFLSNYISSQQPTMASNYMSIPQHIPQHTQRHHSL